MQSRISSLIETIVSIAIGFIIALCAQLLIFPYFGIQVSLSANLKITGLFTIVSVIRGYWVRRLFNYLHKRGILV